MPVVDYKDVQAMVRFGFGKMTEACYYLVHVKNAAAAKEWLLRAPVTTAEITPSLRTALQVAFTRQGLEALGVPAGCAAATSPAAPTATPWRRWSEFSWQVEMGL